MNSFSIYYVPLCRPVMSIFLCLKHRIWFLDRHTVRSNQTFMKIVIRAHKYCSFFTNAPSNKMSDCFRLWITQPLHFSFITSSNTELWSNSVFKLSNEIKEKTVNGWSIFSIASAPPSIQLIQNNQNSTAKTRWLNAMEHCQYIWLFYINASFKYLHQQHQNNLQFSNPKSSIASDLQIQHHP